MITTTQLATEEHLSYRKIDYWIRAGYVPGIDHGRVGSGNTRELSEYQAAVIRLIGRLVVAGFNVDAAAKIAAQHMKNEQWGGAPTPMHLGTGIELRLSSRFWPGRGVDHVEQTREHWGRMAAEQRAQEAPDDDTHLEG